MVYNMKKQWLFGLMALAAGGLWLAGPLAVPAPALTPVDDDTLALYSRAARIVARQVPSVHLNHRPCDDTIATNALSIFLSALDYDHSYFMAADVAGLYRNATELDNQLREGKLDTAFGIYHQLIDRVSNRVDYVAQLLQDGFDFTEPETYLWDRKDQPWPAAEAEWNELWRRKIKNQYLAQLVAQRLQEEAAALTNAAPAAAAAPTNAAPATTNLAPETATTSNAAAVAAVAAAHKRPTTEENILKQYQQYLNVLKDNDAHWLLALYITAFTQAFDPHSDYMSENNSEDFDINMKLSLFGIGALLSSEDGAAKVVRLIPGGPAEKDGRLQEGDKIIAVAQGDEEPVDILHWPLSRSVRIIRGEKGTTVVLTIIPAADVSGGSTRLIDLVRDEVKLEDRAAKGRVHTLQGTDTGMPAVTIGVITIPDFYADMTGQETGDQKPRSVTRDVRAILEGMLASNRLDGVVLDLRNNGGGSLSEAIEMTGLFIPSGPVVQVKSGNGIQILSDADPELLYGGPLLVMVNRQSASASEILAGALQDYGRAIVVGDSKTHGKGTVQTLIPLSRFNAGLGKLKITTAGFYRIAGGSTQLRGIQPDVVLPSPLEYMEIGEEYLPHVLDWSTVDPAYYRANTNVTALLPWLRDQSAARRAADTRYQAYAQLLDHLGAKKQEDTVPLIYAERLTDARHEKEMAKFIEDNAPAEDEDYPADEDDPDQDQARNDLILDESLNILADLIRQLPNPAAAGIPPPTVRPGDTAQQPRRVY